MMFRRNLFGLRVNLCGADPEDLKRLRETPDRLPQN
jgi:hypothetical protein